jgi:hypothetical protein
MAQQVRVGVQPGAGGQVGEGAAGVDGVDRRALLGAEDQVELDRVGGWPGSTQRSPTVVGLHERLPHPRGKAKCRYQRTATTITSGGNRKPAKVEAEGSTRVMGG